jgi:hypothetical protein
MEWVTNNWVQVGVAYVAMKEFVKVVSIMTPWKWDDKVAKKLESVGNIFFKKS